MKRFLPLLLALAVLCLALPWAVFAAGEPAPQTAGSTPPAPRAGADVWDGTTAEPTKTVKRDGVTYFEISTCEELAYITETNGDWLTYNYILANDLILNEAEIQVDADGNCTNSGSLREWTPIGYEYDKYYSGKFDGQNHIISGLYVKRTSDYAGLFGYTLESCSINGLILVNAYVKGEGAVGSIVGHSSSYRASITNCVNYGTVIGNVSSVGGIAGGGSITDCINYGAVNGNVRRTGGIVGDGDSTNCINYGAVIGKGDDVGGITGTGDSTNCINYGTVNGRGNNVGGIAGQGSCYGCANYNAVTGTSRLGGVTGYLDGIRDTVSGCINYGAVAGTEEYVGGIVGYPFSNWTNTLKNCANLGSVTGGTKVGGILGECKDSTEVTHCYSTGTVTATGTNGLAGAIAGTSDHWQGTKSVVTNCYYAQDNELNETITAFGNNTLATDEANVAEAKTLDQLRVQSTFANWIFEPYTGEWHRDPITGEYTENYPAAWAIDPEKNGGYPYPFGVPGMEEAAPIPVTGVSLKESALALAVGDVTYLTPVVSPTNATNTACTYATGDAAVAAVNACGRIEAKAAGETTVTVTTADGGFTAACTVTVTARTANDYRLGALTVRTAAGEPANAIPAGDFWVSVPVTKLTESGGANILLAAYDGNGRFLQMLCADVAGLYKDQTITLSYYVPNSGGSAARVKAFAVPSLSQLTPMGPAAEFPAG